jgi:hypothetical protein
MNPHITEDGPSPYPVKIIGIVASTIGMTLLAVCFEIQGLQTGQCNRDEGKNHSKYLKDNIHCRLGLIRQGHES